MFMGGLHSSVPESMVRAADIESRVELDTRRQLPHSCHARAISTVAAVAEGWQSEYGANLGRRHL
jgi:hypothetical protein